MSLVLRVAIKICIFFKIIATLVEKGNLRSKDKVSRSGTNRDWNKLTGANLAKEMIDLEHHLPFILMFSQNFTVFIQNHYASHTKQHLHKLSNQ